MIELAHMLAALPFHSTAVSHLAGSIGFARDALLHGRAFFWLLVLSAMLLLNGCGNNGDSGAVHIDVIGEPRDLARPLNAARRPSGQIMLAATAQGLLTFDPRGELLPSLAESWIVSDNGRSLIFRLRLTRWPDGSTAKAPEVAALLRGRMQANPRLLGGLRPQVRAMTDRVIEIRLEAALPAFLQLLAHPAMAIQRGATPGGTGPYSAKRTGNEWQLEPVLNPDAAMEGVDEPTMAALDRRILRATPAALGVTRFIAGRNDALLGGRFQDLPLLGVARFREESVRADPVQGLFGLAVEARSGPLDDAAVRRAVASAIDREALASALGLAGWTITSAIVPSALDLARVPTVPEWALAPILTRQQQARKAVNEWRAINGDPPALRIALSPGSGARLLFLRIAHDLRAISLQARLVAWDEPADLRLIDEVAPFDSALWYLARLDCANSVNCSESASLRLNDARQARTPEGLAVALGEAEALMSAHGGFIALGMPIRWSLVSRRLTGFAPTPRGRHPLNRLIADTN
jgi:oligopeptide transport system substrate-binding protein